MKILEKEFTSKGWIHQQITRSDNVAIYKRWKDGGLDPHYEVVKVKSHSGFKIPGTENMSEPSEYYPGENAWGRDGFTCSTWNEAMDKMQEILTIKN